MKKLVVFTVLLFLAALIPAKISLFLQLDKVAKEPNLKSTIAVPDGRTFADDLIAITWTPQADGFRFEITNKTKIELSIPWEECRFINEERLAFRVAHATIGKNLAIGPQAMVADIVAPVDYLVWGKKGWSLSAIYRERWSDSEFETIKNKDLIYQVILPVRKGKTQVVYHFIFKAVAK